MNELKAEKRRTHTQYLEMKTTETNATDDETAATLNAWDNELSGQPVSFWSYLISHLANVLGYSNVCVRFMHAWLTLLLLVAVIYYFQVIQEQNRCNPNISTQT